MWEDLWEKELPDEPMPCPRLGICRNITYNQKGPIVLRTTHVGAKGLGMWVSGMYLLRLGREEVNILYRGSIPFLPTIIRKCGHVEFRGLCASEVSNRGLKSLGGFG